MGTKYHKPGYKWQRTKTPMRRCTLTDAYKNSMAQAGRPLAEETFYLSFRKGGWQYIPFDLETAVRAMLPEVPTILNDELSFLNENGYGLTDAMVAALQGSIEIKAAPTGTWVYQREPLVTVTGPSYLVSWLEPLLLRLFFPIQLATAIMKKEETPEMFHCTCEEQADIVRKVLESINRKDLEKHITVDTDAYREACLKQAQTLIAIVKDPARLFEVGMRAATCEEQHQVCLEGLREAGITATSNMALALAMGFRPVGTMGHEHIQRWASDLAGYRAMRDTRVGVPSYLLDTFDTITSGIPAAIKVMLERSHACSIRYDSGDKYAQYIYAHGEFGRYGLSPVHILEDGLTAEMTAKFETLRDFTGLGPEKQVYGYGGFFVSRHWNNPLSRDAVSAVYKLTQTNGEPRMKQGNEAGIGKQSIPGHPVAWRRLRGSGPMSVIGQDDERLPENYVLLSGNPDAVSQIQVCNLRYEDNQPYTLSPETQRLVAQFQ
jgi:nicotinic acid phosphoribosyltransferase